MTDPVLVPTPPPAAVAEQRTVAPDALLDCLVEICRVQGHAATRASLSAGLPLVEGRLTLELAERAAARAGMAAKVQRIDLAAIDAAALPAVLLLKERAAAVLLGWNDDGSARLLLPETGQGAVNMPRADLQARYTGWALFVRPHFRFDNRTPAVQAARQGHWFWNSILAQRFVYRDVLIAALLVNLFALALPMFTMNVYDRVVPNNATETLWALAIGVILVLGFDFWLRSLRSRFVDEASARIDVQLSAAMMERILGMRLENRPASVGAFASNIRGFEQVRDFIASTTVTALIDLPFALLFVIVIIWLSPWLALPTVVAIVLILAIGWVLQGRLHALSETTWRASAQRNATLIESLTGIETIKSQAAESVIQSKWERVNVFLARTNVRMRGISNTAMYVTGWIAQLASVLLVVIGVYLIGHRELTMGALIATSMLAGRALAPAGQIVGLLMQYQSARTALGSLEQIMSAPMERPDAQAAGGQVAPFIERRDFLGAYELRQVKFAYPGRNEPVLDIPSLRITPGERVALIGRVGSGKSTLLRLLAGLYQPKDGAVLLDGIDLRQLDPAEVRRHVASVSQDVMLFHGSLRENIAFGLPHADDVAIVTAAEVAGLSDYINRHPAGFDMPVGERGEMLSGGQRQAVGLARALLHESQVLLMDEPTSAMDFSTEAQITQRLLDFAQGKTMIVATHRTSLLALATRVVVLDNGKIVADGPRDAVMAALQSGKVTKAE
jgi:ATP-binding cassette, subfamily C, bacterial LapB